LLVLWVFPRIISWLDPIRDAHNYTVICEQGGDTLQRVEAVFAGQNLRIRNRNLSRRETRVTCVFNVIGPRQRHQNAAAKIFDMPDVLEFKG
jgi:hypothetical protein